MNRAQIEGSKREADAEIHGRTGTATASAEQQMLAKKEIEIEMAGQPTEAATPAAEPNQQS